MEAAKSPRRKVAGKKAKVEVPKGPSLPLRFLCLDARPYFQRETTIKWLAQALEPTPKPAFGLMTP